LRSWSGVTAVAGATVTSDAASATIAITSLRISLLLSVVTLRHPPDDAALDPNGDQNQAKIASESF
jgi:hypothetical protein